jgi:7-cyano-7-deazaguanine synthase
MITILVSGGLDSAVLVHHALRNHEPAELTAVTVRYGQPHEREIRYAARFCYNLGIDHHIITAYPWNRVTSPVQANDIPWSPEDGDPMIIRGRNSLFVSLAYIIRKCNEIWLGCNGDDQHHYADCRDDWAARMSVAYDVRVRLPLRLWTKRDVVRMARNYGIDLARTLSCYRGQSPGCGKCNACVLRDEAQAS